LCDVDHFLTGRKKRRLKHAIVSVYLFPFKKPVSESSKAENMINVSSPDNVLFYFFMFSRVSVK